MLAMPSIVFSLNGEKFAVPIAEARNWTLARFLRERTRFTGTKVGCGQGGCGACTVAITADRRHGQREGFASAASCLFPLVEAHGREIRTVEGLAQHGRKGSFNGKSSESKGGNSCCGGGGRPHPIQQRVAELHGTQCGFCTPGMVMAMFGALNRAEGGNTFDEAGIENEDVLAGNICRCTGYRPLNAALKSFARDSSQVDCIGNVSKDVKFGPYDTVCDPTPCADLPSDVPLSFRPDSIESLVKTFQSGGESRLIIAGHTGHGVYGEELSSIFRPESEILHIRGVRALQEITVVKNATSFDVRVGAAATIAEFIEKLAEGEMSQDSVSTALRKHASLIAGHQIRNVGTVGGNLMMCRDRGFASDLATILCGVDAQVEYFSQTEGDASRKSTSLHEFLSHRSGPAVLLVGINFVIQRDKRVLFQTYRTALRSRNAYSLCNAAFCLKLGGEDGKTVEYARFVYGALGFEQRPIISAKAESSVLGASLENVSPLFLAAIAEEMVPMVNKPGGDGHGSFRGRLVVAFAKKFVHFLGNGAKLSLHEKGTRRSSAKQHFDAYDGNPYSPAFVPKRKTSGLAQAMGSINYTADLMPSNTLFGAYISAPFPGATYNACDELVVPDSLSKATKTVLEGARIISYDDIANAGFETVIPWGRRFASLGGPPPTLSDGSDPANDEDLLLPPGKPAVYDGQPVAIVLCPSQLVAEKAAAEIGKNIHWGKRHLKHSESNASLGAETKGNAINGNQTPSKPDSLFSLQAASTFGSQMEPLINRNGTSEQIEEILSADQDDGILILKGKFDKRSQNHFYMETQRTLTVPGDDGVLTCYASAQGLNSTHKVVSYMLGKRWSEIVIKLRRVGGGFGGKLSRGIPNSVRSAACAAITGRAVLIAMTRENDISQVGGREEMFASWRAAIDRESGKIKGISVDLLFGAGSSLGDSRFNASMFGSDFDCVYEIKLAECTTRVKRGHTPPRTAVRTPIHFETALFMESVLDKIAFELGMDSAHIREINFASNSPFKQLGVAPVGRKALAPALMTQWSLRPVWDSCKSSADYDAKLLAARQFNQNSVKKGLHTRRGVGIAPGKYTCYRAGHTGMRVRVNILDDGSIQVHSGGAELGQGLLTKVGQCVCATLTEQLDLSEPLDLDYVRFRDFDSGHNPNQGNAGGSTTSETAVHAAEKACVELAGRLKPWRKGSRDWRTIVSSAKKGIDGSLASFAFKVNFDVSGFYLPPFDEAFYPVFGASVSEVEIDVLTGETKVLSSHIVMDSGKSLNPAIDIGQVEGAFVMGLGQVLLEQVLYDKSDGTLQTDNTWTYKPPAINDIPENFIVELRDFERDRKGNGFGCVLPCLRRVLRCCGPLKNPTHGASRYRSNRAMGEPPMMTVTSIGSALRQAIVEARKGDNDFDIPIPCTPEDVSRLCLTPSAKCVRPREFK